MPHPCFAPFQPAGSQRERRSRPAPPDEVQFEIGNNTSGVTVWSAVGGRRTYELSINELLDRLRQAMADDVEVLRAAG